MKFLLLGAVLCMFLYAVQSETVDEDVEEEYEWKVFKASHNKKYSDEEDSLRKKNFSKNKKFIDAHNQGYKEGRKMFQMKLNRLADMTQREINQKMKGYKRPENVTEEPVESKHRAERGTVPVSYDWRKLGMITPIKDQGGCGSCYSFATIAALESYIAIKSGTLYDLSEQNIVDCSLENFGCGGGWPSAVSDFIQAAGGVPEESDYPYTESKDTCKDTSGMTKYGTITGWKNVVRYNEEQLKYNIANIGPIVIGINASWQSFSYYSGGIYSQSGCNPENLDHAVVLIGYGVSTNGTPFWIIKNSWNTWWGENGYMRIVRNQNMCGVATDPGYPIVSA